MRTFKDDALMAAGYIGGALVAACIAINAHEWLLGAVGWLVSLVQ